MPKVTMRSGFVLHQFRREIDRLLKKRFRPDHVVGRHHRHDRIGIVASDFEGGQANAGRRVAFARFAQDAASRQFGQLLAERLDQPSVGHDQHALGRDQAGQAIDRRLNHGPRAHQLKQLLGTR